MIQHQHVDTGTHPLGDTSYVAECRRQLDAGGALVLSGFFSSTAIAQVVAESALSEKDAFYANTTHNVYLTPSDPDLTESHTYNRQVISSKGLIADDQIPADSPLREVYDDPAFRSFLCGVLGIEAIYPYADHLSSINVHYAPAGRELGWHFDNSSFAVTMLLQAPEAGGLFEFVPAVRDADVGELGEEQVGRVLDGKESVSLLEFEPGDLVLFRGRNAMHRVRPTEGEITRILVVFAFNDQPDVALSESVLHTFYGRTV